MNYYRIAQKKYKRAVWITKFLRYVPGVRMIAVCNSLSYNLAKEASDIDLFVITKKKRIWTARFFSLLLLDFFGLRPQGRDAFRRRDSLCLSFFVSEDALCLEGYQICSFDRYLRLWIQALKPLYEEGGLSERFFVANAWALPQTFVPFLPNYKRRVRGAWLKSTLEYAVTSLDEKIYKYVQLKIMPTHLRLAAMSFDSCVIISDRLLKFHANDRRLYFNALFFDRIKKQESRSKNTAIYA